MNFVPFHLKETTQSITQIVRILSCHILIYYQISMVTSKATNGHFSAKNMKFSIKEFIRLNSRETRGLDQIMTISAKNTKFSRQEFIRPYHREIHGLDQNCENFVYFQVSKTHSHAPSDEKSSASRISANLSTCTQLTL